MNAISSSHSHPAASVSFSSSRKLAVLGFLFASAFTTALAHSAPATNPKDLARWQASAQQVTISRDQWGIPHVAGKSDADAVFGLLYAQAEDDFKRIELNYINALGRLAEVEGEVEFWRDLRMKLFIQPAQLKAQYAKSPAWLKQLMNAFADGLNYYLHTHPEVKPRLITHFEPWMALAFSEGSIGGDIESVNLNDLNALYGDKPEYLSQAQSPILPEPRGSNGFAIAPKLSANGQAMLLINPHTSFYFRPEVHVRSEQGLNAYGAVTWGQFFVYQGFNQYNGWMHTSNAADVIDEFALNITKKGDKVFYTYEGKLRPLKMVEQTIPYSSPMGMVSRKVKTYFSHHGPVVREANGKWIAVQLMNEPMKALMQSYLRTKTRDYAGFAKVMDLRANSSNNTVYADKDGNIAYFHGDFVPRRNPQLDWTQPVDGSKRSADWQGLHEVKDIIHLFNPKNGWIQNTNNWPFSAAGVGADGSSPRQQDYPRYMWTNGENARGQHAVKVLKNAKQLNLESLIKLAYDSELTAFETLLPALFKAYDVKPEFALTEQIKSLRAWDLRATINSTATSLAIYWAQDLVAQHSNEARQKNIPVVDYLPNLPAPALLAALQRASNRLQNDFGNWQTAWGDINRFQRLSGDIQATYDDNKPSWPVAFASGNWGSLAAFGMTATQTTKRIYGDRGNSFVAAVSFGPRIQAKSILAGGNSGDPKSPHFNDQGEMYSKGEFKDVLFYPEDIDKHTKRKYHPGQ
ncbi:penicillin acylase family protein [Undibacterium seohonense]|uniref:Penicillin acylase family protein n=1 Tax=Undibacterium seohonense TaxID=1344950 RepID=A0ABR6X4N7_9BURK|nr:penicillin acylase family protein [Undibacterium seohonense]MBC3807747.1 penicillin acylase family protein [Undibacterium seohonense]